MPEKPKILKHSIIAQSRLFRVEQLDLQFSNGEQRQFERLKSGMHQAVLIVPVLNSQTFLLIREYAAGTDRYELGFPKGLVEPQETLLDAANRELQEEVGFGARHLEQLTCFSLAPGYIGSTTNIILARDLYPQQLIGDEPEPIDVVEWKFLEIDSLLTHPEFTEARSVAALLWVDRLLHNSLTKES
ncbi:MAG: ADP compounds hydrolase NudE [Legionellales bacterium]|nr:ADP compounds hydrolase NudE [Legionellales bacterium]